MYSGRTNLLIIVMILMLSLAGCSASQKRFSSNIYPSSYLNPNIRNQASPLVISFYQLKSAEKFKKSTLFALLNDANNTLVNDLLDKKEIEIRPGQKETVTMSILPSTNYIGIIGAFRQADKVNWRELRMINPRKNVYLEINVTVQGIELKK